MTRKKGSARPHGPSRNDEDSLQGSPENEEATEIQPATSSESAEPTSGGIWLAALFLVPLILLLVWGYLTR